MGPPITPSHVLTVGRGARGSEILRQAEGIRVSVVEDRERALDLLREETIDCVYLDRAVTDHAVESIRSVLARPPYIVERLADGGQYLITAPDGEQSMPLSFVDALTCSEQASARLLAMIVESTDDVLWMFDRDWSELHFVNAAVEELFGITPEELDEEPRAFLEAIHPDDRDETREGMERLSAGSATELQYRVQPEEDVQRWAWVKATPLEDEDGNVSKVIGFTRDVTEWKHHQRELDRYRTVVENSGDPMYMLDADGTFTFVNEAMGALTGHDRDSLLGESARIIFPTGEYERGSAVIRHLLSSEERQAKYESALETADGRRIPCENQLSILRAGSMAPPNDFQGTVGVIRDISERKRREDRLAALHAVAQELMGATSSDEVANIGVDAARRVLELEANSIHLFEEGVGLVPVAGTEAIHELVGELPTFEGGDSIAWRSYENGESSVIEDVRTDPDVYNPSTGTRAELYLPIGDHGILIASSPDPGTFDTTDVTFGELLADNIATVLDRVEREARVREREAELRRQNERLDAFASIVSHDLRNPLTVAQGRLELAKEAAENDHHESIERALCRMESLIDELLVFARMGEEATDLERLELADVVREAWAQVETQEARLVIEDEPTILADGDRLARLLENLVRNAIEHGGSDVTVTVRARDDGFSISDDGPGIPAEKREEVFERGYSTRDRGTGFGLAIVEEIADAHGWDVAAVEPADGGATFAFRNVTTIA